MLLTNHTASKTRLLLLAGALFAVMLTTPATAGYAQSSNETAQLMSRINQLENQVQTLSRSVYRGAPPPSSGRVESAPLSAGSGALASYEARLGEMEQKQRTLIGGLRFYERQEIRDAIAYLRVLVQQDDDLAFERIINLPKRGIGDATVQIIHGIARAKNVSLFAALRQLIETEEFKPKVRETLRHLVRDFDRWREQLRELSHTELTQIILDESGYTLMWQADKSPEAAGRLENLKEFVAAMNEFESMDSFLEHVALVMETQEKGDMPMVSIMTLHGAKGLEFDVVFLPGWEEGVFPNQRSMDENGITGLEEERRLAYVGLTRARKQAFISFAANRLIYGSWTTCLPSRFIDELPKDNVEVVVDTGLYQPQQQQPMYSSGFRGRRAKLVEDYIPQISAHQESEGGYKKGERVFHEKFGYGLVLSTDNDKLDISFDKAGRKKVMDSFVRRADS